MLRAYRGPILAALITLLGLALRLWGIGWSLPDSRHPLSSYHPDELVNLGAALNVDIPHGQFDPGFYNYGAFYFYLASLAQTVGRGYHLIPATPPPDPSVGPQDVAYLIRQAPERAGLLLAGRVVTALMGTATIPIIYLLGVSCYGRRTGLLGALFYAIAPLAVAHSHFMTVDVPATLFVAAALLASVHLMTQPSWRRIAFAGVWCGLAAATKYSAAVVVLAPFTALVLCGPIATKAAGPWSRVVAQCGVVAAVGAAVFLLACPGPWLNWSVFWNGTYPGSGVRYELFQHAREGHGYVFVNTGPGWWYHLAVSLRFGLGLPLLLLSLAGLAFAIRRRERADIVLAVFVAGAFLLSSLSAVRFARYLIPLYPALSLLAARLAWAVFRPEWITRCVRAAGLVVCPLLTLVTTVGLDRAMAARDPRDQAADYIRAAAKPGATIAFAHIPWFYSPPLSPFWGHLAFTVRARAQDETGQLEFRLPASGSDWDPSILEAAPQSALPDFVVLSNFEVQHEALRLRRPEAIAFMRRLDEAYTSRRVFRPPPVPGVDPEDVNLPQDLEYILPVVTVYSR